MRQKCRIEELHHRRFQVDPRHFQGWRKVLKDLAELIERVILPRSSKNYVKGRVCDDVLVFDWVVDDREMTVGRFIRSRQS